MKENLGEYPGEHPFARLARELTPARVFATRKGTGLSTHDWLALRADHAAARDAVFETVDLPRDFGEKQIRENGLFAIQSQAPSRAEYLVNPDLGRHIPPEYREQLVSLCPMGIDFQIVLGDGLSATAVIRQGPELLDLLSRLAREQGWSLGRPFFIHQARVGLLNEIGLLLDPVVVVLLIGERPGLSTADSLSAYLAFRPKPGDTDARRNLISNIHARGVTIPDAAARIIAISKAMMDAGFSGVALKEDLSNRLRTGVKPPETALPSL